VTTRYSKVPPGAPIGIVAIALIVLAACGGEVAPPPDKPSTGDETRTRHVPLEGQPNFRDLGGYRTADGRTVKWGQVYRSGELGQLTDEDVTVLEGLELRTVVNFLLPEEIEKHGSDRLPESTREVASSIASARAATLTRQVQESVTTADFESIPPALNPEFHRLLLEDGKEQYAALLRELAGPANRPLAFHCSHGIHRTGTATAILLSVLGVPWETIREDYLLSNELRREEIDRQLAKVRQVAADRQGVPPDEVDMTNVEAFYVLDGSYIDGALERAVEEYGTMEAYVRDGLGLTDEEIARLRDELLQPAPE
jgi:protein-tyrosine phosphatase